MKDESRLHPSSAQMQAAVVTVSDRCAAGLLRDTAGPAVAALLTQSLPVQIAWAGIVPDEIDQIAATLTDLCARKIDLILTVGGTGMARRDVTPEATLRVIERQVPGLAEAMRMASFPITPFALLSRAVAGTRGASLIVNLPGSAKAAVENLSSVLAVLPHAVKLLRGETAHQEEDAGRSIPPTANPAEAERPA
jgi:molybdenum cofactor synthesis domain-containing protein